MLYKWARDGFKPAETHEKEKKNREKKTKREIVELENENGCEK